MSKTRPPSTGESTGETPKEFPQTPPPPDLYATSDIRFVMLEIGKLTANVERLISDVKLHGGKIDDLSHKATYIKGWIAAAILLIGIFMAIASFFLSSKWDATIQAIRSIPK